MLSLERSNAFFQDENVEEVKVLVVGDLEEKLEYEIAMIKKPYNHSRMGRTRAKTIPVTEVVIVAKHL